jgi:hypothetical protein
MPSKHFGGLAISYYPKELIKCIGCARKVLFQEEDVGSKALFS